MDLEALRPKSSSCTLDSCRALAVDVQWSMLDSSSGLAGQEVVLTPSGVTYPVGLADSFAVPVTALAIDVPNHLLIRACDRVGACGRGDCTRLSSSTLMM